MGRERADEQGRRGVFSIGRVQPDAILVAMQPQPGSEVGVGQSLEPHRRPARRRRGVADGGERVARVELAVA